MDQNRSKQAKWGIFLYISSLMPNLQSHTLYISSLIPYPLSFILFLLFHFSYFSSIIFYPESPFPNPIALSLSPLEREASWYALWQVKDLKGEVRALQSSVDMKGLMGLGCSSNLFSIFDKIQLPAEHASQFCPQSRYDPALA